METKTATTKTSWRKLSALVMLVIGLLVAIAIIVDQWMLPMVVRQSSTIEVHNVVGLDEETAQVQLTDRDLQVMPFILQYSSTIPKGRVMSQSPYAGASVKPGRRIYLTVSQGIESIKVPLLRSLTLRDARLSLIRTGLQLGNTSYEFNDSVPTERVIQQSSEVGSEVQSGTKVSVVISRGKAGVLTPDVVGLSMSDAEKVITESGLIVGTVTQMPSGTFSPNTVLRQNPAADSSVAPGTFIHFTVAR